MSKDKYMELPHCSECGRKRRPVDLDNSLVMDADNRYCSRCRKITKTEWRPVKITPMTKTQDKTMKEFDKLIWDYRIAIQKGNRPVRIDAREKIHQHIINKYIAKEELRELCDYKRSDQDIVDKLIQLIK